MYYFSKLPCLNYNHVIITKDFHNVFAYYSRLKPQKVKISQRNFLFHVMECFRANLHKKIICHNIVLKMQNYIYLWNDWNDLIFLKIVISTKHCDSIWLEYVCEPCEEFDNYYIINGFSLGQWLQVCSELNFSQASTFKWKITRNVKWDIWKNSIWNIFWLKFNSKKTLVQFIYEGSLFVLFCFVCIDDVH